MNEEKTVTDLIKYDDRIAEYQKQKFNILLPTLKFQSIPPMCEIAFNMVEINSDPNRKEVYPQKNGELSHTKHGIDKLAAAAGVIWDWRACGRLDNGSDPQYCHYRMVGIVKDFDGTIRNCIGDKEVDLRDGSDQIKAMVTKDNQGRIVPNEKQIAQQRQHILSLAQSKAANRALRSLLQIKHSYTAVELKNPFVVPKLIFRPDMNDPVVKQAYIMNQLQANTAAFGSPLIEAKTPTRLSLPEMEDPDDTIPGLDLEEDGELEKQPSGNGKTDTGEPRIPERYEGPLPWEETQEHPPVSEKEELRALFENMDKEKKIEELKRLITMTEYPVTDLSSPMETWKPQFLLEFWELLQKRLEKKEKDKPSQRKLKPFK
jgi:hypothetical protein